MELVWQKLKVGPEGILRVAKYFSEEPGTSLLYSGGSFAVSNLSFLFLFPIEIVEIRASPSINPWTQLENLLKINNRSFHPEWVGFLGYEMGVFSDSQKEMPYQSSVTPDAYFQRSQLTLEYDHQLDKLSLYKCSDFPTAIIEEILLKNDPLHCQNNFNYQLAQKIETRESYINKVEQIKELILNGDIYQVNLAQQILLKGTGNPFEIFLSLLRLNPAPFTAYIKQLTFTIVSTSPERFLKKRSEQLETRPIKGTAPRGKTEEEDRTNQRYLMNSPKEIAELLMITDLMRNDLGKVSCAGTVQTSSLGTLELYTNVFHKHAVIESQALPYLTNLQILRSCFPGGSITGCPKLSAMQVIQNLEKKPRGIYTGSIGYFTGQHDFDFNIAIRTLVFFDCFIDIRLGSGIVADSNPISEYEETLHKGASIFDILNFEIAHSVKYAS